MKKSKQEKADRALALEIVNHARIADGLPPIKRIAPLWWKMYGHEYAGKGRVK